MEAENYLSSGHGLRLAIQARATGWKPLSQLARVWQPSRLKGIQVSPEFGTPFLTATQVFDIRPAPRKWLALDRTEDAQNRFITPGTLLVTCSGAVGRATLANITHERKLISHDLLRVAPNDDGQAGWLYAYLRSPQAQAMMTGAQYGHIIKHLEVSHLDVLPVPVVKEDHEGKFQEQAAQMLDLRNQAYLLTSEAEKRFAAAVGPVEQIANERGFGIRASQLFDGRRRLEAGFHAPAALAVLKRFAELGNVSTLSEATERVWWESRFRRFYGEEGLPYSSADELFSISPLEAKRILVQSDDEHEKFYVKRGWIVMACSGQVYGLNGAARLMTEYDEDIFFSHDLIRISPKPDSARAGYLLTALTHPTLGRPLLIRAAYGTSIPHLDPGDVGAFPLVRLASSEEDIIADLAEKSAQLRAQADVIERSMSENAGRLVERFVAGDMLDFVTEMPVSNPSDIPKPAPAALIEHSRVRLRRALPEVDLPVGAAGTVVHVYKGGKGYEVEFTENRKRPVVETLFPADVEPLTGEDE